MKNLNEQAEEIIIEIFHNAAHCLGRRSRILRNAQDGNIFVNFDQLIGAFCLEKDYDGHHWSVLVQ